MTRRCFTEGTEVNSCMQLLAISMQQSSTPWEIFIFIHYLQGKIGPGSGRLTIGTLPIRCLEVSLVWESPTRCSQIAAAWSMSQNHSLESIPALLLLSKRYIYITRPMQLSMGTQQKSSQCQLKRPASACFFLFEKEKNDSMRSGQFFCFFSAVEPTKGPSGFLICHTTVVNLCFSSKEASLFVVLHQKPLGNAEWVEGKTTGGGIKQPYTGKQTLTTSQAAACVLKCLRFSDRLTSWIREHHWGFLKLDSTVFHYLNWISIDQLCVGLLMLFFWREQLSGCPSGETEIVNFVVNFPTQSLSVSMQSHKGVTELGFELSLKLFHHACTRR